MDFSLSGKRDSNPRPLAWEANALPTELLPLLIDKIKEEISFMIKAPGIFPTLGFMVDAVVITIWVILLF